MESYAAIAEFLKATGPYGLVAILGWAFWRVSEKKDAEVKALYEKVAQISEAQTLAITKVESALVALREAIDELRTHGSPRRSSTQQ
ncbi:MAG: hypothetical protein MUF54_15520 [Polyangiaceae bacterium]|jgi:hypothetical protein|nr:hypothetical protein [Polyangiaceae bacterium]